MKVLEHRLEKKYQELDKAQIETVARKRQEEFDKQYPTTDIAAVVNPKLFISRHFLSPDGAPDPTKTPNPIVIRNISSLVAWKIEEAVLMLVGGRRYSPGNSLETRARGPTDDHKVLALGWNRMAVWDAAGEAAKPLFDRQRQEDERRKQRRLEFHRGFVSILDEQEVSICDLKTIQGQYFITCERIEREWPDDVRKGNDMILKIMPEMGSPRRNLVAEFHFAVVEGLMRLRPAGITPTRRQTEKEKEKKRQREERTGSKMAQEQNEVESKEEADSLTGTLGKRKAVHPRMGCCKKCEDDQGTYIPKPDKVRLDFDFRGRETGESEVEHGAGWIEWDKQNSTQFQGIIHIGFLGSNVPFYGYKTDLLAKGSRPESEWSDYTENPYGMGPRNRWRF